MAHNQYPLIDKKELGNITCPCHASHDRWPQCPQEGEQAPSQTCLPQRGQHPYPPAELLDDAEGADVQRPGPVRVMFVQSFLSLLD